MLDETNQEGVAPHVAFQMVHLGLLEVADVAYPKGGLPDGEVEREELAYGRLVVQGGEADVLAEVLSDGHFIIGLPVFRGEHYTQHGNVQLITYHEWMFLDVEAIHGYPGCTEIDVRFGIDWIVGIPEVVNHASVQLEIWTSHEYKLFVDVELIVVS